MTDVPDDEALSFDANAAILESRRMWLALGRNFAAVIDQPDWIDNNKAASEAMEWAAQAEACFWRATGDMDCADAEMWVPALARTKSEAGECPK